ncbi:dimethyl sulfoxide reductase anchor subunit family protein [Budvicia diplopodorum]|uniref:dimethyl sulfoxide reductase anchor subunit family protein n=1 Tax=Budvicia diplopodorum TaxID=1119056 RepID=UPI00135948F0|nr:DmsC/YnfH family molybdoenzyme membrane anchor subunit [Budvicia diplopodorum]
MHEWPLIAFTLLIQASVGATLFAGLFGCWINKSAGQEHGFQVIRPVLLTICIMTAVGLMLSVAHLGYPMNAFNSLRHAGSSWLSREIISTGVFFGVICLVSLRMLIAKRILPTLLLIAAIVGLVDVFCMAEVYRHTMVVTWAHINTQFTFFGSVLALGASISVLLIALKSKGKVGDELGFKMVFVAALFIGISLVGRLAVLPCYISALQALSSAGGATFPIDALTQFNQSACLRMTGWIIGLLGLLLTVLAIYKGRSQAVAKQASMLTLGSLLVIAAEIVSRYTFFMIS